MKIVKKMFLILIISIVLFIEIEKISSLTPYSGGHSGEGGGNLQGDYNEVNGLRIVVLDKDGNRKAGTHVVDVLNPPSEWLNNNKYYALSNRKSLVEYSKQASKNGEVKIGNWNVAINSGGTLISDSYFYNVLSVGAENFHEFVQTGNVCNSYLKEHYNCDDRNGIKYNSIKNYLESNNYDNLKKLVSRTGYKCDIDDQNSNCTEGDYISVEILFQVISNGKRCVGTGFEIALDFKMSYDAETRYKNTSKMLFLDKSLVPSGSLFEISAVNSGDVEEYDIYKAYEALNNYSVGVGFSLYSVEEVVDIPKNYKVVASKINSTTKQPITSSTVGLKIHINSSDCDADGEEEITFIERGNGQVTFDRIPAKFFDGKTSFSIEEIEPPDGYLKPTDTCVFKNGILNKNMKKIVIENTPGCIVEFNSLSIAEKNDTNRRYEMYQYYLGLQNSGKKGGGNFTNLLNLNYQDGINACSEAKCTPKPYKGKNPSDNNSLGCMEGGISLEQEFNSRNMACFDNELVDSDNKTVGLCSSTLKISKPADISTDIFHYIKRGLPIFTTNYPIREIIETMCYSFSGNYKNSYKLSNSFDIKNTNISLKYMDKEQLIAGQTTTSKKTDLDGYIFTTTIDWNLKSIFMNQNGKYGNSGIYSPIYGVMSKTNDPLQLSMINNKKIDPEKFGIISFTASLKNFKDNNVVTLNGECKYSFQDDSIYCEPDDPECPSNLNIEFRTIDVNNPFPGESGNSTRPIGTNWRGYVDNKIRNMMQFDFNKNGKIEESEARISEKVKDVIRKMSVNTISPQLYYTISDAAHTYDVKLDLNDDQKIDMEDARMLEQMDLLKFAVGLKGNNYIDEYIKNAPNSYGRDGSGKSVNPIYTITLTPSDIKQIRKYNSYTTYDDYISLNDKKCDKNNLDVCNNVNTFKMKFIDGLKKGVLQFKGKSNITLSNKLKLS